MRNPVRDKFMLSAGEISGDLHGYHLAQAIKKIAPDSHLFGLGGIKMRQAGVDVKYDVTRRGVVGLWETLRHIPALYFTFRKACRLLDQEKPDVLILIDSQGFNMPLAKVAKKKGIKTVYYIAPQEWLWGTPKGIKAVVDTIDKIIAIFPKEAEIYQKAGGNVAYFGHPLIDIVKPSFSKEEAGKKLGLDPSHPIISLFPGSRYQEINLLLPIILESAAILKEKIPNIQFILSISHPMFKEKIEKAVEKENLPLIIIEGYTYDLINVSNAAIAASGTLTLEIACLNIPMVVIYKLNKLTYLIAKNILHLDKKIKYFAMPNLLLQKKIVPELAQKDANPEQIVKEIMSILKNNGQNMRKELNEVKKYLGNPGVVKKAAQEIINFIK